MVEKLILSNETRQKLLRFVGGDETAAAQMIMLTIQLVDDRAGRFDLAYRFLNMQRQILRDFENLIRRNAYGNKFNYRR